MEAGSPIQTSTFRHPPSVIRTSDQRPRLYDFSLHPAFFSVGLVVRVDRVPLKHPNFVLVSTIKFGLWQNPHRGIFRCWVYCQNNDVLKGRSYLGGTIQTYFNFAQKQNFPAHPIPTVRTPSILEINGTAVSKRRTRIPEYLREYVYAVPVFKAALVILHPFEVLYIHVRHTSTFH